MNDKEELTNVLVIDDRVSYCDTCGIKVCYSCLHDEYSHTPSFCSLCGRNHSQPCKACRRNQAMVYRTYMERAIVAKKSCLRMYSIAVLLTLIISGCMSMLSMLVIILVLEDSTSSQLLISGLIISFFVLLLTSLCVGEGCGNFGYRTGNRIYYPHRENSGNIPFDEYDVMSTPDSQLCPFYIVWDGMDEET